MKKSSSLPPELLACRDRIDAVDDAILRLLNERARIALTVAKVKSAARIDSFHDPERERRVLSRLTSKGGGPFPKTAVATVFREVMSGCLSLEKPLRVAFLGPEGTFSQMAARHMFGLAAEYAEAATIEGVFDAVESGESALGIVPIENSTEGSVTVTLDTLIESPLLIRQELELDVSHALLSKASSLSRIQRVYSHMQALSQCRRWLAKSLPSAQLVQTTSTSAAAIEATRDASGAAIGSRLLAELHSLDVLRDKIQDRAENATRFVVVSPKDAPPTGADKTSIAFSVRDGKGALRKILSVFEESDINLTRITSRPTKRARWEYVFLVDLEGHKSEAHIERALARVKRMSAFTKVLGSYPNAAKTVATKRKTRRR